MLFNIVLVPMQIVVIYIIYKTCKNIDKSNFFAKGMREYDNDKEFIVNFNKKYLLPPCYIYLLTLIYMSINTIMYSREIYDKAIRLGFNILFVSGIIYIAIGTIVVYKKRHS